MKSAYRVKLVGMTNKTSSFHELEIVSSERGLTSQVEKALELLDFPEGIKTVDHTVKWLGSSEERIGTIKLIRSFRE